MDDSEHETVVLIITNITWNIMTFLLLLVCLKNLDTVQLVSSLQTVLGALVVVILW
jgi:hypothetical protein